MTTLKTLRRWLATVVATVTVVMALLTVPALAQFYPSLAGNPATNTAFTYVVAAGSAQAQTVAFSPAVQALVTGMNFNFMPVANNTGAAPTLQVNSLTAVPITKCGTTALAAADLKTGVPATVIYDGTQFQLFNPQSASCGSAGSVSAAWSNLTDPTANLSRNMSTFTTLFTFGDLGASPTDLWKITDSSTTSTDTSNNVVIDTGSGSFHNPLVVSITGSKQLSVCRQPGPQGEVVFGSTIACASIDQSPFAKVVMQSGTAAHDVLRLFQGSTSATGNMITLNNATASGSGFFFFKANSGCTDANTGCDSGATVASLRGDGLFSGTATLSTLTLNAITGSTQCLQVNSSGVVSGSGSGCGGTGSGTVTSSTAGQIPWFAVTGTTVVGNANLTTDSSGNLVSAGTGTFTQVITTGPWLMTSPWPTGALAAGSASQTLAGVDNDGLIKISVNADGPLAVSRVFTQGSQALGTSAISSGTCTSATTITATGLATTDIINWQFNADVTGVTGYTAATTGALRVDVYPTANTINIKQCNPTASSITPGAATINYRVTRK